MASVATVVRTVDYRAAERAAPCVCGGYVVADPTSERLVEMAVKDHQRTLRHMNWRASSGW